MFPTREEARARLLTPYIHISDPSVFFSCPIDRALESIRSAVIEDVLAIVVDGKRYPSIGPDETRLPESLSTRLARSEFGVDPFFDNVDIANHCHAAAAPVSADELAARATLVRATAAVNWIEEAQREEIIADVLDIVFRGKRYPNREETEEERIPEDVSTHLAHEHFGVDAYEEAA